MLLRRVVVSDGGGGAGAAASGTVLREDLWVLMFPSFVRVRVGARMFVSARK